MVPSLFFRDTPTHNSPKFFRAHVFLRTLSHTTWSLLVFPLRNPLGILGQPRLVLGSSLLALFTVACFQDVFFPSMPPRSCFTIHRPGFPSPFFPPDRGSWCVCIEIPFARTFSFQIAEVSNSAKSSGPPINAGQPTYPSCPVRSPPIR